MHVKLKPETVKRLAAEHRKQREAQKARLIARLSEKAAAEGPDSIWTEMLSEVQT